MISPCSILNNKWEKILHLILFLAHVGAGRWQSDRRLSLGPLDIQNNIFMSLSECQRNTGEQICCGTCQLSQHLTDVLEAYASCSSSFCCWHDPNLLFFLLLLGIYSIVIFIRLPLALQLTHPTKGWAVALLGVAMPFQIKWPPTVPLQLTGPLTAGGGRTRATLTWVTRFVISLSGIN